MTHQNLTAGNCFEPPTTNKMDGTKNKKTTEKTARKTMSLLWSGCSATGQAMKNKKDNQNKQIFILKLTNVN